MDRRPEYQVEVTDARSGMRGFLVIDDTTLGPGKGGIRMTPNVSLDEVRRLAKTMTWKNALAGIPFGGAKAGLIVPRDTDKIKKKELVQAFARALSPFIPRQYIAGPDVNSGEEEMRWIAEELGQWNAATGKPKDYCEGTKCGLPHELGSTGFGVAHAAGVAARRVGIELYGARVAIHGFGNVATFAAKFLSEMGATVVAMADRSAIPYEADGLKSAELTRLIIENKKLAEYEGGRKLSEEEFWALPVDILIPASVTDVINERNKDAIQAKMIVEGGNIPMQEWIEDELFKKGIVIVPDFVANAGGVISSYAEYRGMSPKEMFLLVKEKIEQAAGSVMSRALNERRNPRAVALEIAKERLHR